MMVRGVLRTNLTEARPVRRTDMRDASETGEFGCVRAVRIGLQASITIRRPRGFGEAVAQDRYRS